MRREFMVRTTSKKAEAAYQAALARINELMDVESESMVELELLAALVELHEKKHYPIVSPDLAEAIRFRLEQSGVRPGRIPRLITIELDDAESFLPDNYWIVEIDADNIETSLDYVFQEIYKPAWIKTAVKQVQDAEWDGYI